MPKQNYSAIREMLGKFIPFEGNTMWAEWDRTGPGRYVVYSYRTPIASYDEVEQSFWRNADWYSPTTTKHQNIVREAWGI